MEAPPHPITHPALIPSEVASSMSLWDLKGVLAELEYHFGIEAEDVIVRQRAGGSEAAAGDL